MRLGPRLELKQSLQLVMTPQLQQAIKLLQMSHLDVSAFVAEEVEKNPLLTIDDGGGDAPARTAEEAGAPRSDAVDRQIGATDPSTAEEAFETGGENLYEGAPAASEAPATLSAGSGPGGATGSSSGGGSGGGADLESMENRLADTPTLRDHLLAQIAVADGSAQARTLAALLVDEVDDAGYLTADIDELARRLGARCGLAQEALDILQTCEPTGVGARSLRECLALQLRERDRCDPAMEALLDHLPDLAAARLDRLRSACGVDAEDLTEMIAEIRALDPRPGSAYGGAMAQAVVPDVLLARNQLGGWNVELNPDALPRVLLDTRYATELTASGEATSKAFVATCRQNADWLLRALDQRAQTILKVSSEIVRRQHAFLQIGVSGLKPMTLKSVADEIGLHESTVSRVTANKYMSTERGMFELKFFFTQAIGGADGADDHSAEAVRHQIRSMIENEDSKKALSDDKIAILLKESGVNIARRTVAKYREAMNIPSSAQRKRMKAAALS